MIATLVNDRYRLDAELGRGGMGVVYRAHDTLLDRDVAVKVLSDSRLGTEGRSRLLHEARAAARLNHPNIVSVHDAGEYEHSPFIIMELVKGTSLHEQPPRETSEKLTIACQICNALEHAHTNGVVHRDLKPENVLITKDGVAKLMDFGLARSVASRLTSEGTIVGTVFYLAPEQALGGEVDGRADLYALGVMLYELTTGRLPFTADDPVAVISQHLHAPIVPPRAHNDEIAPALDALIVGLMSKRPEDRPTSAGEVLHTLERLDSPQAEIALSGEVSRLDRIARGRLVGRDRELAEATSLWQRAVAGEGGVLLLSGEPGIGKTRLVQEIATRAEVSGGRVLVGECFAEGGAPYTPVAQIIRAALTNGFSLDLPDLVVADLINIAPDLRARYPDVPTNPPLDPAAEQQRLFESVVAFCNALTDQTPLLLFLDDVHWADSGTLYLLRHLARRMSQRRSLIVAGYREVELGGSRPLHDVLLDLNRARLAHRLKLSRLDRQQTHDLLAAMFAEEITPEFLDGIFRETEGNPFFIEEVVRELVESGKLYFQDGRWVRPSMDELEIPQSVRVAIQARVANLPEKAQDALRLAAVLGREFDFETLAEISEADEDELIDALEYARDAQFIEDLESRGGEWFSFVHALVAAALRENLSGLRRGRLHRRVAAAIEKLRPEDYEALAYHYGEAGDETRALVYIIQAADRALATYANHDAENHYRAALEIVEVATSKAGERAALLYGLGEALFRQGHSEEALHTWREAIRLYQSLGDDDRVARLYGRSARAAWWNAGDAPRGLELAREGLAAVDGMPETVGLATLLHETGRACHFNLLSDEAIPFCHRALEIAEHLNDVELQAEILSTLGLAYTGARQFDASITALKKAVKLAESAGLFTSASRAHHNLGGRLVYAIGDLQAGRDHLLRGVEFDQRAGTPAIQFYSLSIATLPFFFLGDFVAVEEMLPRLEQLLETVADLESYELWLRAVEALLVRYRGDVSQSAPLLTACHAEARRQNNIPWRYYLALAVAETLLELGQWHEAQLVLTDYIDVFDWYPGGVTARCLLSTVSIRQGRTADAYGLFAEAQRFDQPLTPFEEENLLLAQARLATAEGRWSEAMTAFESAAEIQARIGKRWYRAQTLREWAGAHAARNEQSDLDRARELLREAQAGFEALNVPKYAAQVSERLSTL